MPPSGASRDSTRFVALFQKAHSYIAALQRIDDQIAALFETRRKAIEDMRAVQLQINTEFQRVLELDRVIPADTLSQSEADDDVEVQKPAAELKPTPETRVPAREPRPASPIGPRLAALEPSAS